MSAAMHTLVHFSRGEVTPAGFRPSDGGISYEADQLTWEIAEVLRVAYGIHIGAFIPELPGLEQLEPDELPSPGRCLEVFSEELLGRISEEGPFAIRDPGHASRAIESEIVVAWIRRYRQHWDRGEHVVRLAQEP
ncbi:MAG: hypothetical protein VKP72_08230 [bacterium]|nr:hypothetical protein [bacterium]